MSRIRRASTLLLLAALGVGACAPIGPSAADPTQRPTRGVTATATPATGATEAPGPEGVTETAQVVRIVDGDTVVIDRGRGDERLRYIGIDTPETVRPDTPVQPFGEAARDANRALVDGREVVLERDVSDTDRFGRLLRYVWLREGETWLFVNLELVRLGFAHAGTYPPDVRYTDLLLEAERDAREHERGLWSTTAQHPAATGTPGPTARPAATPRPAASIVGFVGGRCDPAYRGVCIPPAPPDLDCPDIAFRRFEVVAPDPHRFDGDRDGIGCEND